ncbi:MAG: DUF2130 domain-containing protein [Candidatus Acidiferrales bacterium]|jgi:hypothetical protein
MNSQPSQTSLLSAVPSLPHLSLKSCPTCGQEIPPDKLEEIGGRIAAREREQILAITAQLEKQYALEKAQAESKAKADLEAEREQSAIREARAREEAEKAADRRLNERLAEAEENRAAQAALWQRELATAQAAQKTAEETSATRQAEISELRESSAKRIEAIEAQAKQRELEIRDEAKKSAEAAAAAHIAEIEKARRESDAARIAAEQKESTLAAQLEDLRHSKDDEIARVKQDNVAEVLRVQQVTTQEAETRFRETVVAHENAVAEANAKAEAAEAKLVAQADEHNASTEAKLKEQREVLEKAAENTVNAEKARAFEENQKLTNKVTDLQRALENKTAEELGEGAEIDLFEALKQEFPEDDIRRIPKGTPGADILHVVMLSGKKCGTIIYDSKNHNQFRNEHVTKLRADQLAAQAEHAILSTRKFPQGTRQLHLQDGVLLANPARVVLIAKMIRQHLQQLHAQRVSDIERDSKTAALYEFIVSERCASLLSRIDERAEDLLEQQQKEMKWHENNWKRQGEAIRAIQKAKADLENQVNLIIGTSSKDAAA